MFSHPICQGCLFIALWLLIFDELLEEKEITAMMKLSEVSLKDFLDDEPDIYSIKDVKVRYR